MRKLALALIALFALLGPAQAQPTVIGPGNAILCNKWGTAAPSSATTTSVVPVVTGQSIQICGWMITTAAGTTFQLEYGTGAACTSPTVITPVMNIGANPVLVITSYATQTIPVSNGLCVVSGGALQIIVFYSQF